MIFSAGLRILIPALFKSGATSLVAGNLNIWILIYFLIALFVLRKWKLGPIKVMVSCGVAELIVQIVQNVVR